MTRYRTIVADPPWPLEWTAGTSRVNGRGERHPLYKRELGYITMTVDGIAELRVRELADDDCHLYLWVPDQWALDGSAVRVAEAWGFKPRRLIVWRKEGFGQGTFPRPQHELVLVCERGSLPFKVRDEGSVHTWKQPYGWTGGMTKARLHSAKPDGFYDLVERASYGPRLEMFARRARFGWDYYGDESLETVEKILSG